MTDTFTAAYIESAMTPHPYGKLAAYRPRVGQIVDYMGVPYGFVTRVEGGLCYARHFGASKETLLFSWYFEDRLNALLEWPTKG
jgi:hypothetical protein